MFFYFAKAGEKFENLIFLILNMLWLGVILGGLFVFLISLILKALLFKYRDIKFKDYFAIVSIIFGSIHAFTTAVLVLTRSP